MRSWKKMSIGLKLSLGATVILALSIVGVLAAERFDQAKRNDAAKARETATARPTEEPGNDIKLASNPLELGTAAKVSSNYRVAVTALSRYDAADGQLIVATVEATYTGKHDGEPWSDLDVQFAKDGMEPAGASDCPAGVGDPDQSGRPTLTTDEKSTFAVCIDVPVDDIAGGQIVIDEAFADGKRSFWSTEEAVEKTLPAPAPDSPADGAPGPRRQPAYNNDNDNDDGGGSANCDDWDQDKYEDSKKRADYYEDYYEKHKDDLDDETIDEYKEWKEDHDKMIEYYEKWDEVCD